jgi:hypothetical protein
MLPLDFLADVENLRTDGFSVETAEDGFANAVIAQYSLPPGYSSPTTTLLLRVPMSYRNGRPDMFWTESDLSLSGGRTPHKADQIETYLERRWRRFSWHAQNWNPAADDLRTYLEFVNEGLRRARQT